MPHLVVSSIGTSLITNAMPREKHGAFFALSNMRESELTAEQRHTIDAALADARAALATADRARVKRLSAELNGVLCLIEEMAVPSRFHHILIGTDTYAGRATTDIVYGWLLKQGHGAEVLIPADLRTSDLADFRSALSDLVQHMLPVLLGYRDAGHTITFNLTGGFKSVPGFLQALATVVGAEAVYVFEAGPLLRIPRLPLRLDTDAVIGANVELFRALGAGVAQPMATVRAAGIPETLLLEVDGDVLLSEWGEVVWQEAWARLAAERLLPPRSPKVRYGVGFENMIKKLPPERLRDVNRAIEGFTAKMEGQRGALRSEKFEKLQVPQAGSSHELYAWSTGGTGRIFLHEVDGVWVLDDLGAHL